MTTRRDFRLVSTQPDAIDVSALIRADIAKVDWARVQIEGDRRSPIYLPDARRRLWR